MADVIAASFDELTANVPLKVYHSSSITPGVSG